MTTCIKSYYQRFRARGERAKWALRNARTLEAWQDAENAGLVRIVAEPEQESYFSVYGTPDTEKERKAIEAEIEHSGCWCVLTEYLDDSGKWRHADSIGMCTGYDDPCSAYQNDYVPQLMQAALDLVPQQGKH